MRSTHQLLAVELQNGWQNITISSTNGYKIQTHLSGDVTIMAAWIVYTVDYSRKLKAWVGLNARRGHAWAGPSPTIPNPQAAAVTTSPWQWPSTSSLLRHSHYPFRLGLACGWSRSWFALTQLYHVCCTSANCVADWSSIATQRPTPRSLWGVRSCWHGCVDVVCVRFVIRSQSWCSWFTLLIALTQLYHVCFTLTICVADWSSTATQRRTPRSLYVGCEELAARLCGCGVREVRCV